MKLCDPCEEGTALGASAVVASQMEKLLTRIVKSGKRITLWNILNRVIHANNFSDHPQSGSRPYGQPGQLPRGSIAAIIDYDVS